MSLQTNTNAVTKTDREALGPQPDNTPVGGGNSSTIGGGSVTKIIAGTGISVSPVGGTGNVTVSATATGTVTSITTTGRGATSTPNPIVAAGTINNFDPDHYNVADYGAVPNSSGAAGANVIAISTAIAALIGTGGCLFFPQGVWYINSLIDFSSSGVPITVQGCGVGITEVRQTAANTGVFNQLQTVRDVCFTIQDIRLSHNNATALSTAAAVEIGNNVNSANDNAPNLIVNDVDIRCDSGSGKAFTYGFRCSNIKVAKFCGYSYTGTNANTGSGIKFQGYGGSSAGLKCIGAELVNCFITLGDTGVIVTDAMEGLMMTNCQMIGLVYGVNADYCIHIGVHNTHINASVGIRATGSGGGIDQALITGCLIYQQGANFVGVEGDFSRGAISGNSFVAPAGDAGTKGVNLTGGSGMAVTGNTFYDQQSTYVTTAGANSIVAVNCATKSATAATNPYLDSGAGNTFVNNIYVP